jgi:prepilin-type N-terminal cleavage/methylation domain-containing protein/prepilin-type processing-associated H-X9-DG protein
MTSRKISAFSLIELLVCMAILAILMGLAMPGLSRVREQAKAVQCRSNLHQIGIAIAAYAQRNGGALVPSSKGPREWPDMLFAADERAVVICPANSLDGACGYQLNSWLLSPSSYTLISRPLAEVVLASETPPGLRTYLSGVTLYNGWAYDPQRHGKALGSNFLWMDFHVSNDVPKDPSGTFNPFSN